MKSFERLTHNSQNSGSKHSFNQIDIPSNISLVNTSSEASSHDREILEMLYQIGITRKES
jgi:hypothetical protein